MPWTENITEWYAAARAAHVAGCLAILSVFVFDRFIVGPARHGASEVLERWKRVARGILWLAIPLAILSGAAWFLIVAAEMSGLLLRDVLGGDVAKLVWHQTQFGRLWRLRSADMAALLIAMASAKLVHRRGVAQPVLSWLVLLLAAALVASLAWSGHGQTGGPRAAHLAVDALHLLVAGCWPTGLLPLVLLMIRTRSVLDEQRRRPLAAAVFRFSAMALVCVALLAATGLFNAWWLVGSFADLVGTDYGRVLIAKVAIFCVMIILGAVNLLWLKPRLVTNLADAEAMRRCDAAGKSLLKSVTGEAVLALAIIGLVGVLGILPPPAEHRGHHHHASSAADNP